MLELEFELVELLLVVGLFSVELGYKHGDFSEKDGREEGPEHAHEDGENRQRVVRRRDIIPQSQDDERVDRVRVDLKFRVLAVEDVHPVVIRDRLAELLVIVVADRADV